MLECLAPVAGGSARALKRFVNLYLLLRAQYPGDDARKAAALALAVDAGGGDEFAALEAAVRGPGAEPVFDPHRIGPRLAAGLQALAANGARLDKGDLRAAIAEARLFSFRS
ncbi:hypothetical protein [Methylocella sp.]|uniref:hypothetical protein n=1 Tax=Methylocella sp. TaxID=1978226 RepID=UPI0037831F29